jgi:hypothetical protein
VQGFGGLGLIDLEKAFTRIDEASGGVVFRSQFDSTSDSNPSDVLLRRYDTSQTLSGDT